MKKSLIAAFSLVLLTFVACGPAAEDREKMHQRAKVFQDSIANVIRTSMAEAEAPGPMMMQSAPAATAAAPGVTPGQVPHNVTPPVQGK